MRKKLYILIVSILTLITISTAFIPFQKVKTEKEGRNIENNKISQSHPEAGYIEEIGY